MALGRRGAGTILITESATGREVNIFKSMLPEELAGKLHAGAWKITNGFWWNTPRRDGKFVLNTVVDGRFRP